MNFNLKSTRFQLPIFLLALFLSMSSVYASPETLTYLPQSYITVQGTDGGQPVSNLQQMDASGMENNPSTFVQFFAKTAGTPYAGYRSYFITNVAPASITALKIAVNFRGPVQAQQTWTWSIYDWVYNGWVPIGNNAKAFNWGPWSEWTFNLGGRFSNYINSHNGEVRIQVVSNNAVDDMDLDYEAVIVTADSAAPPAGHVYFVSLQGSDSNPGTLEAPWRTISKAAKTVPAGSTVYVRGGVYNERVAFSVSGSAAAGPTTFMSYPGESAIIDATNVKLPANTGLAPTGLVEVANQNYLIIQGFEIRNINLNSANIFPAGISVWGISDHIEIRQNHIHNISNGNNGAHGIGIYGTASPAGVSNLVMDGNEVNALTLGESESVTLNGNVYNWTVSNNIIHDNNNIGLDAIGFEKTASNSAYDQARNGSITGNLVYNINDNNNSAYSKNDNSADGIYVDGGTQVLIEDNIVHHCNIGIEVASEHKGKLSSYVTVRNNIVYLSTGPGMSIGGYDTSVGSTDHCTIVNNTLFSNDSLQTGSGEFQIQFFPTSGTSNNIFMNNILYSNSQGLFISNGYSNPVVNLDYNLYYSPSSPDWNWKNRDYTSFINYKSKTGNDAHSLNTNPQFISTATATLNFYLLKTSQAINAGTNLGQSVVGITDISGQPRVQGANIDIGAYEQ